jgi:hypothetical protein
MNNIFIFSFILNSKTTQDDNRTTESGYYSSVKDKNLSVEKYVVGSWDDG